MVMMMAVVMGVKGIQTRRSRLRRWGDDGGNDDGDGGDDGDEDGCPEMTGNDRTDRMVMGASLVTPPPANPREAVASEPPMSTVVAALTPMTRR
jgi:hypothetical protein